MQNVIYARRKNWIMENSWNSDERHRNAINVSHDILFGFNGVERNCNRYQKNGVEKVGIIMDENEKFVKSFYPCAECYNLNFGGNKKDGWWQVCGMRTMQNDRHYRNSKAEAWEEAREIIQKDFLKKLES